jgi:proteic killer suppression protein
MDGVDLSPVAGLPGITPRVIILGKVIRSFRDRDSERLFHRQPVKKLGSDVQRLALRKLRQLDAAVALDDLRIPPGNRLEKLRGDRAGQYSVRINDQWRICFRWAAPDAHDVEIVDYH